MKRFFDILISFFSLILLAPVFLLIALFIQIDSAGGCFFRQWRVGRNGKEFLLWKFRTMHPDADRIRPITISETDPRITRVGQFLRRFKLDELPQLINVMKGEMSMVGPRPELRRYVDMYDRHQRQVLDIRPGITDIASLVFAAESEILEEMPEPETFYIQRILPLKIRLSRVFVLHPTTRNYFSVIGWSLFRVLRVHGQRLQKCEALCREWLHRDISYVRKGKIA